MCFGAKSTDNQEVLFFKRGTRELLIKEAVYLLLLFKQSPEHLCRWVMQLYKIIIYSQRDFSRKSISLSLQFLCYHCNKSIRLLCYSCKNRGKTRIVFSPNLLLWCPFIEKKIHFPLDYSFYWQAECNCVHHHVFRFVATRVPFWWCSKCGSVLFASWVWEKSIYWILASTANHLLKVGAIFHLAFRQALEKKCF